MNSSTKELWIFRISKIFSKTDVGQLDFVFGINGIDQGERCDLLQRLAT